MSDFNHNLDQFIQHGPPRAESAPEVLRCRACGAQVTDTEARWDEHAYDECSQRHTNAAMRDAVPKLVRAALFLDAGDVRHAESLRLIADVAARLERVERDTRAGAR